MFIIALALEKRKVEPAKIKPFFTIRLPSERYACNDALNQCEMVWELFSLSYLYKSVSYLIILV